MTIILTIVLVIAIAFNGMIAYAGYLHYQINKERSKLK